MEKVSVAYANAMFDLALEENTQDEVKSQMSEIYDIVNANKELLKILQTKGISKDDKKSIVEEVFGKVVDRNVLNFLKLLVDKSRISYIKDITKAYKDTYLNHFGIKEAIVYSTTALSDAKLEEIKNALELKHNQKYEAINKIDTSLIAGIKVVINDLVIDGSVDSQLKRLKSTILKNNI